MILSTAIAANRGLCDSELLERLTRLLDALRLPVWHEEMPLPSRLMTALAKARDHRGGAESCCAALGRFGYVPSGCERGGTRPRMRRSSAFRRE